MAVPQAIAKLRRRWEAFSSLATATGANRFGKPALGERFARRAVELYAEQKNDIRRAEALMELNYSLASLEKMDEAMAAGLQALPILEQTNHPWAGKLLLRLGSWAIQVGELRKAIDFFERALADGTRSWDRDSVVVAWVCLGQAYLALQLIDEVKRCAEKCVELGSRFSKDVATIIGYDMLAGISLFDRDPDATLALLQKAMAVAVQGKNRLMEGYIQTQRGKYLCMFGNHTAGLPDLEQGLQILETAAPPMLSIEVHIFHGRILAAVGEAEEGEHIIRRALESCERLALTLGKRKAWLALGEIYKLHHKYAEAELAFREVIHIDESALALQRNDDRFKVSFAHARSEYAFLQEVLAAQGKFPEALEVSERGRARAFLDLLQPGAAGAAPPTVAVARMLEFLHNMGCTAVEYTVVPDIGFDLFSNKIIDVELFVNVLRPPDSLEFRRTLLGKGNWRGGMEAWGASPASTFGAVRDLVLPESEDVEFEDVGLFHNLLVAPIADLLTTAPTLVFIPDVALMTTPFAALRDAEGRPLVERYSIMVAPSINALIHIHDRRRARPEPPRCALIVGDPDRSLRFARDEATGIAEQLSATQTLTDLRLGAEATKSGLLASVPHFGILHFATHGRIGDTDGPDMPGALLLAPQDGKQAWLTSDEVMKLQLNADLVVLSACYSGAGRETSDGIIGLSRAFLAAGANAVLVALWKIPDKSTEILMREFYRCYLDGPDRDKAKALRAGMLEARKFNDDPASWAAFHLIGERF